MSFFSGKKLLLVGFLVVLLIAIPITVYLVGQQQKTKSGAEAATNMFLTATPQTAKVNDTVSVDVTVDPSNVNQIAWATIVLSYDPTKLATTDSTFVPPQWPAKDGTLFTPSIVQGPTYGDGTISVSMSVAASPQNVITTRTKIATFTFKALSATEDGAPTEVKIVGSQTQLLSSIDQAGGPSVLSNVPAPADVIINGQSATETPTDTPTPTTEVATDTPTDTPTPTDTTDNTTTTTTDTPTPTGTSTLTCTSLTSDSGFVGTAPFALNLTAIGTSSAANITKVTFDFGDGQTQDVTDAGGVGTTSINILASHTYATSGTFNAKATLTDENGNTNSDCTATITVNGGATASPTQVSPSPLPATGPTGLVTIGALGILLTFVGAILLFAL